MYRNEDVLLLLDERPEVLRLVRVRVDESVVWRHLEQP